jgi:hypothetical protein
MAFIFSAWRNNSEHQMMVHAVSHGMNMSHPFICWTLGFGNYKLVQTFTYKSVVDSWFYFF